MSVLRSCLILLFCLLSAVTNAQEKQTKVVLHVNDGFKLGHLQNSVNNIRNEMGKDVDIKVVINGKAVTRLLKSNLESAKIVQSVLEQNVPIGLCHNAVNSNKVDRSVLIEGLEVLDADGNVTIIRHLQKGYLYIKL